MSSYRQPASKVTIGKVDTEGLWGREEHPPVEQTSSGRYSPCDGKIGYVIWYEGWDYDNFADDQKGARFTLRNIIEPKFRSDDIHDDKQVADLEPEAVHAMAPVIENEKDEYCTHFYRVLVPNIGIYQFADYEFESM